MTSYHAEAPRALRLTLISQTDKILDKMLSHETRDNLQSISDFADVLSPSLSQSGLATAAANHLGHSLDQIASVQPPLHQAGNDVRYEAELPSTATPGFASGELASLDSTVSIKGDLHA